MEIRNLQKTGGSSLTLTLPKQWVNEFKLNDKDKVVIIPQKSGLLFIQPYSLRRISARVVILSKNLTKETITREIVAAYISGADEITIKSDWIDLEIKKNIRSIVQKLIGMETMEETTDRVVLKNVFDIKKFSIKDNLDKMFLVTSSMFKDMLLAIEKEDRNIAFDVIQRDEDVDRLYLAITRQFHSLLQNKTTEEELGVGFFEMHYFEEVANELERIADHIVKISKIFVIKSKASQKFTPALLKKKTKKPYDLFLLIEKAVKNTDKKIAHQILDDLSSEKTPIDKGIVKKNAIDIIIEDSSGRILGYISNIAEETIDYVSTRGDKV